VVGNIPLNFHAGTGCKPEIPCTKWRQAPARHHRGLVPWLQPKPPVYPEYLVGPDLAWCVANDSSVYRMVIEPVEPDAFHEVTFHVYDGDEEAFSWTGSPAAPLVRDGDKLYLADFHPPSTGCSVLAYDLARRKQLWYHPLKGLSPVDHSIYRNSVTIQVPSGLIEAHSVEAAGEYIEELDTKSGATVTSRILWRY
jgi:hypothetical protein